MTVRQRVYALLDGESHGYAARRTRALAIAIILLGLGAVAVGTVDELPPSAHLASAVVTGTVALLFLAEYVLRLWVAPENAEMAATRAMAARVRWALSPTGLIDLLAIVPALAVLSGSTQLGADEASVFVLLWVLKLATHAPGVALIARVIHRERRAIGAVLVLFVITLMVAATLAHFAEEAAQPQAFGSIPAAMWWAMVTLTTAGYGDVIPQTFAGRLIASGVMVGGIAVLALLAGILATGFGEEMKRRDFVRIWDLVARVPFLAGVGALAVADIVPRLRARDYPAGALVVRRGAPGDAMYFIVSGEVDVRLGPRPVRLRDGAFFGEMALLDRRPRSADVVTATPCTLLVLNVSDFYELAARQPTIAAAIEAEAKRRQAANRAAASG